MCGMQVGVPPQPPGMQYGTPPYPPPPAYAAPMGGPPPSKKMAMTGGIFAIVLSSLYLLIALLGTIGAAAGDEPDKGSTVAGGMIFLVLGLAGVIFGVFAVKGRWWGALVGAIIQTLLGLLLLLTVVVLAAAEDAADSPFDQTDAEALGIVKAVILGWLLVTVAAAVLNYLGIPSARRWEEARSRSHLRAADQF
jgi:hypothetical protein